MAAPGDSPFIARGRFHLHGCEVDPPPVGHLVRVGLPRSGARLFGPGRRCTGVDPEQDGDAVPGPLGHLGGCDSAVEPR